MKSWWQIRKGQIENNIFSLTKDPKHFEFFIRYSESIVFVTCRYIIEKQQQQKSIL